MTQVVVLFWLLTWLEWNRFRLVDSVLVEVDAAAASSTTETVVATFGMNLPSSSFTKQQHYHQQQRRQRKNGNRYARRLGFGPQQLPPTTTTPAKSLSNIQQRFTKMTNDDDETKFGMKQRFASIQCLLLGAVVGSIVQSPISLLHDTLFFTGNTGGHGGWAQWEYDTDMAAIAGGLFAIVYRYCIREDITNPQLNQGLLGAMILIRTLPQIQIPSYCHAIPLNCGRPPLNFYIFDWNVIQQLMWCGLESTALFVGTAAAMDMAMEKGYIIRFPG
jgi:hypothetical protein